MTIAPRTSSRYPNRSENGRALQFLLHQALSTDHEQAECAADHLDRWIQTANRKFMAPSAYQVPQLTNLLRLAQSRHPRRDWRPVDRGLAAFV
jgi:hypothetical protein